MKVSVVIPSYNAEDYIYESIESVLKQTYPVEQIIVVDDGSSDETVSISRSFGYPVLVVQQPNRGVSVARNIGVDSAKGDLIAFLDADDLWTPDKVEHQVGYMAKHNEAVGVVSGFSVFGTGMQTYDVYLNNDILLDYQPLDFLAFPKINPSILLIRSEIAKAVRFPENVRNGEDLIYAAQVRAQGPIGAIDKILARRRQHPHQVTESVSHFTKAIKARIDWVRENYRLIELESAASAESAVLEGAVREVMVNYWKRDFYRFKDTRQELLSVWPDDRPVPKELLRFLPPKILVRLKDFIDCLLNRKKHALSSVCF